jgi:predicted transcriptional regulator
MDAGRLLSGARARAGLSQRELARRADTAQSVVARIELGETDPRVSTLVRLVAAAGLEVRGALVPRIVVDTHMLDDIPRILRLTPEERLLEAANLSRLETAARRV